jgi:transposase-like protein
MIEQDHRPIKKRTKPMLGFKNFQSAKITIAGIENICMIQKGQVFGADEHLYAFENFKTLMASQCLKSEIRTVSRYFPNRCDRAIF